jgi:hypothetical protein
MLLGALSVLCCLRTAATILTAVRVCTKHYHSSRRSARLRLMAMQRASGRERRAVCVHKLLEKAGRKGIAWLLVVPLLDLVSSSKASSSKAAHMSQ